MTDSDILAAMGSVEEDSAQVSDNEQVSADNYSLPLSKDNFVKFNSTLTTIQDICNDCDIHEGKIRCRSNDHKNMILIDLTSIIGQRNITFSGLKNKLSILRTFNYIAEGTTDTTVLVEANDSNFEFSDVMSKLIIRRPIPQYLENVYITDSEFEQINQSFNREDAVLFTTTINGTEKKRIASLCDLFTSNTVTFEFNGDTACYSVQTSSKDNLSKTKNSVAVTREISGKKTLINNLAFTLDTPSAIEITCYLIGTEYCMFRSNLNYFGIPVTIYTKSRIVDMND